MFKRLLFTLFLLAPAAAFSEPIANNSVLLWNETLIQITRMTSAQLVHGPPEVARHIALLNTAMFNAANRASGLKARPYRSSGPAVAGASSNAAVLQAGYDVLSALYDASSPEATPLAAMWSNGPALKALLQETFAQGLRSVEKDNDNKTLILSFKIGATEASQMLQARLNDNSLSAIRTGLAVYTPKGSGSVAGVYVPPQDRPAMYYMWSEVEPFGLNKKWFQSLIARIPEPLALGSGAYAAEILATQCLGGALELSEPMAQRCAKAGHARPTQKERDSALFWNDPGGTSRNKVNNKRLNTSTPQ